jgi:ubiquinone/menaquinone biosynthesis C-methylase UbiE
MTWEETIKFIRTQPEYKDLVKFAYFEEDLKLNVERFKKDEEFAETKKIIQEIIPFHPGVKLLDIGSGNGITALAFALEGIRVDAVEPDPSETIGAGAIRKLKNTLQLSNIEVHEGFAEELNFADCSFDIVYTRQCMHHAHNLQLFIKECFRVLKKGGLLITVRDHVVFDEADKKRFLETHPLQKFYGGENAYTRGEYSQAMINAGFKIRQVLKHYDSVINYFPLAKASKENRENDNRRFVQSVIEKKLGVFAKINWLNDTAKKYVEGKLGPVYDETQIPGRMYTFLAIK